MKADSEAQGWIKINKEVMIVNKDTSKPISFKTIQKNKKLGEFIIEEEDGTIKE